MSAGCCTQSPITRWHVRQTVIDASKASHGDPRTKICFQLPDVTHIMLEIVSAIWLYLPVSSDESGNRNPRAARLVNHHHTTPRESVTGLGA